MAEAVLDQVALHLVEMEAFIGPTTGPAADVQWRRQGVGNCIGRVQAALDVARVSGRRIFSGEFAIEASTADMAVRLDLPAVGADTLGDPRIGVVSMIVDTMPQGHAILAAAQLQIGAQKARVSECAVRIGEMIQRLEIALEMHAAAGTTLADDEFAQAVAQTSQIDVLISSKQTARSNAAGGPSLRIQPTSR